MPYKTQLTATGTQPITYTLSAVAQANGFLCDGKEPCVIGCTTGIINGTPLYERTSLTFTVTATNAAGSASKSFTIKIKAQSNPPRITTEDLPEAIAEKEYSSLFDGFTATGDTPITWSMSSGTLPSGLSFSSSGKITGKPKRIDNGVYTGDVYKFKVTASNKTGSATKEFTLSLWTPPKITTASLKQGYVGEDYTETVNATGSNFGMAWIIANGALPNGIERDQATIGGGLHGSRQLKITGTPTQSGSYSFTLGVESGRMVVVGFSPRTEEYYTSRNFTISIAEKPAIEGSFKDGRVGADYSSTVEVKGGFPSYSWTYDTQPNGLNILRNGSQFTLYGQPGNAGEYSFTLKVTDTNGKTASKTFYITVAPAGLAIDTAHFPDANFRSYVLNTLDINRDGYLSDSEIAAVKNINVDGKGIANLKGVEFFTQLETLHCAGNSLTALDVSKNTALTFLDCSSNRLTALDISKNTLLEFLDCSSNSLTALNTSKNQVINNIHCYDNQLTALNLGQNTELEYLACQENKLTKLDVSKNTKLKGLYCNDNSLSELIVGNNSVLEEVECDGNSSLKTLDIQGCPKLSTENVTHDTGLIFANSGQGIDTPEIQEDDELPEFGGCTLSLEGKIGLNFYVHIPEAYNPENCYMTFESRRGVSNEEPTQKYNPKLTETRSKGIYHGYTCYINSAQMAEDVKATFHFNGNTISKTDSVNRYLNLAHEKESQFPETLNNLMRAIRDYGHYSQLMLSINGHWVIGDKYLEMPRATEISDADIQDAKTQVAQYAKTDYKNSTGISKNAGYSLSLDSETILNVSFTTNAAYNGNVSISVDGKAYEAEKVSNGDGTFKYTIRIKNISAPDLNKTFSVTAEANGINMVNISALSYVRAVLNATQTSIGEVPIDVMQRAVTAFYRYHAAAKAYFGGK